MGHRCWLAEGASLKPVAILQGRKNTQLAMARRFGLPRTDMAREGGAFKVNCIKGAQNASHG
jgi:hypothetical protein